MPSNPDESPDSSSNLSPTGSPSASRRDWLLVTSRILIALMLLVLTMTLPEMWRMWNWTAGDDVDGLGKGLVFYMTSFVCLGIIWGLVSGIRQFKLQPDIVSRASRLSDEHLRGTPSWDELQEQGGTRKLFAWLMDGSSMIAGVFLCALGACITSSTQPILAAVFLTAAILFPSLIRLSRKNAVRRES